MFLLIYIYIYIYWLYDEKLLLFNLLWQHRKHWCERQRVRSEREQRRQRPSPARARYRAISNLSSNEYVSTVSVVEFWLCFFQFFFVSYFSSSVAHVSSCIRARLRRDDCERPCRQQSRVVDLSRAATTTLHLLLASSSRSCSRRTKVRSWEILRHRLRQVTLRRLVNNNFTEKQQYKNESFAC